MKIGLIGSAGCGKGYVAKKLSKELNIPYLSSKDITRPFLKRYGYIYKDNDYVEDALSRHEFEIVDERIYEESLLKGGFVTDRTTLECFCYAFFSINSYSEEEFDRLEKMCKEDLIQYDWLFYFPLRGAWFESNEIRTMNYNVQRKMDILIRGMIEEWQIQEKVCYIPWQIMKEQESYEYILKVMRELN